MKDLNLSKWPRVMKSFLSIGSLGFVKQSFASSMPFVSTMENLKKVIAGPFLLSASTIMIVVTCIMLAFGEWGDGFKKILNIVFWLSIAFGAASFMTFLKG